MKLFHVSDVHFGAEDPDALDWFRACVAAEAPDAVVMTGDLTMRARAREFERGGDWLASLGVPVTVEIGNHDIPYYWDPVRRLVRPYRRYLKVERMIERPLDLPGVTVVPLKTIARMQWRLNQSEGHVSRRSLERALRLVEAAPAGNVVLVAAHHPLVSVGQRERGGTHGGAVALARLAEAGAHAVLSGHVHFPFDISRDVGGRTVRMIGAGTLSRRLRGSPPAFNELMVEAGRRLDVVARVRGADDQTADRLAAAV